MKELLRPIYNHPSFVRLRNLLGLKTVIFKDVKQPYSASDLFFWRTDNGFTTNFRASDIARNYFDKDSILKIIFFNKHGEVIKNLEMPFLGSVLDLEINNEFIGCEDFGSFVAFNLTDDLDQSPQITNRCYTGYSLDHDDPTFVHGNVISKFTELFNSKSNFKLQNKFFEHKKKTSYYIQKNFKHVASSELIFTNPLNRKITIDVNGNLHLINSMETKKITISGYELIKVKSDYGFPRPLIFSYSNNYFDVHHA